MGIICPLLIGIVNMYVKRRKGQIPTIPNMYHRAWALAVWMMRWSKPKKNEQRKNMRFKLLLSRLNHHDAKCQPIQSVFFILRNAGRCGILLPKLFWPTGRKNCSSYREKRLKFSAFSLEFAKILSSLKQFIQTVKGQNNFW